MVLSNKTGGQHAPPSVLVLGVGNILMGDEGTGVRVVEAMQKLPVPDHIELIDGGTASIDIQEFLKDRKKVIIIDAVQGGGESVGSVYRFTPGDIRVKSPVMTSLHQVGLLETLAVLKYTDDVPDDIVIYGIEIEPPDWNLDLSPEIAAVIPRVIDLIRNEAGF